MSNPVLASKWRVALGVLNLLLGGGFFVMTTLALYAAVQAYSQAKPDAHVPLLWAPFLGGLAGGLLWMGLGDVRGRRHGSWILRGAIYFAVVLILLPMIQVAREAAAKKQIINNLKQLGAAVQQYEAKFKLKPAAPPPATGNVDGDR